MLVPTTSPTYILATSLVVNVDQPPKVVSALVVDAPATNELKLAEVAL